MEKWKRTVMIGLLLILFIFITGCTVDDKTDTLNLDSNTAKSSNERDDGMTNDKINKNGGYVHISTNYGDLFQRT